jgi:hypothetical protein
MPNFQQARDDLRQTRQANETARLDLFASSQRLKLLEKERASLERQRGDDNANYTRLRNQLDRQIAAEKAEQARQRDRFSGMRSKLSEAEKNFGLFIDPRRELASNFSNETPFLLFPLRLETRFKTVNNKPQLWVRVYPDDCMVDSFEQLLSRKEVNNAARFWAEYYSAGKPADPAHPDPATWELQKAAWRLLVTAHGDGRAAWITRQLIPDEATSVFPVRGPKTVILAIATDTWNQASQAVIIDLFKKLWFAGPNDTQIKKIKSDFNVANPTLDADTIIDTFEPVNFSEKLPAGLKREEVDLQFGIVLFTDLDKKAGKEHGWSQATRVKVLPERLALIRYKGNQAMPPVFGNPIPFPLPTSPDPSPDAGDQFKQNAQGDLEFADPIKWVADFDRAVEIGMGFRVDLAADELDGFTRLLVLGTKLGADAGEGKTQLEELFDHHYFSKKGFSIIPQGTPTNNTGSSDSGYTSSDKADQTFNLYFKQTPGFDESHDLNKKADGQWLAEWLGLDYDVLKKVLHSDGLDQSDARSMNVALWPATLGYVMESLMQGGFTPETIAQTRDFFNSFVSGRGPVPAVRIGNQPYGILPTAAFRRLTWMNTDNDRLPSPVNAGNLHFLAGLYQLLLRIDNYWMTNLVGSVAHVAQNSALPYQTLLDIVGLHPNSVEFHRRYLESLIEMSNTMSLIKPDFREHSGVVNNTVLFLHETLGYQTDILPQLAALLGLPGQQPVNYLIDDSPLSESKQIRAYTSDKKNYVTALLDQARKSEDALRMGEGLTERPDAELYRLLKYALEQGYHSSGIGAADAANAFPPEKLASLRTEQPFTHQEWKGEITESRYALLYQTVPAISPTRTVSEFVRDSLLTPVVPAFSRYLSSQLDALERLQGASSARLERALVEHLDCCSYRLDGWKTGILANELAYMRNNSSGVAELQRRTGIFLGAFGWLENVRPDRSKVISAKKIPEDLVSDFNPERDKVFLSDSANEGYIHTPSLNQGVTSAVLRNGYISHGKPDSNNVLAVNLSSERIRLALSIIEGIQGGQSLAALLGYHFERELHDRDDLKFKSIDSYIYSLRKLFPLNADQLKDTKVNNNTDPSVDPATVPITAIEARNVIHGVNLSNYVKMQTLAANRTYPFGLDLNNTDPAIAAAITDAVNHIIDIADAIADMGVAESVHHIVMGNYDRAAGVLDAYSKGNYPQEPDVIRTPRSGATLTHRVSIPLQYVALDAGEGPRAQTEPSINQWAATILPPLSKIVCHCAYMSRADGLRKDVEISLQDIGLKPIDLLYVLNAFDTRALNEIDDRFIYRLYTSADPQIDGEMTFNYVDEPADTSRFSVFQVMPLIKSLRALLVESSPLTPADLALPNEASKKDVSPPELSAQRVQDLVNTLKALLAAAELPAGVIGYLRGLPAQDLATDPDRDDMRLHADATINRFAGLLLELGKYGISQTGIGSLFSQRQQWFTSLKSKVQEFVNRWQKKADDYAVLAANPAPPLETLQAMERLISATPTPADSITLTIVTAKKALFDAAFGNLKNVARSRQPTLIQLIQDIEALNTVPFDLLPLDISNELRQVPVFVYDLQARAKTLTADLEKKRIPAVEAILPGLGTLTPEDQAKQIETAARIILGDQFKMIPRYALSPAQQAEIRNSWNATADLLNYSMTTGKRTHPQEDWLHGMARVHDKMKHLENCVLLREAFGMTQEDISIHPVQLPFKTEKYHWLALPFPKTDINLEETNTLLYTAFTSKAAAAPTEVCGVLVDEWTELIPAKEETTGITFHYDRPNSEAPQTMLLVTPTQLTGNWQWNDLVDALVYTLDAARSRGIEPRQIDKTPFASLLPAVLGAESLYPYTIVMDNKAHYMSLNAVKNF